MKTWHGVRLGLYAVIIAVCVTVVGTYWTMQSTVLQKGSLGRWAKQSNSYASIRDALFTPKITEAVNDAKPNGFGLLPDNDIRAAINHAITPNDVAAKSQPALDAIHAWLDSKADTIEFSIPTADLRSRVITNLTDELSRELQRAPICSFNNSYSDIENGLCQYGAAFSEQIKQVLVDALESNLARHDTNTITASDITIPASIARGTKNLPDILNLLYMAAIFCGGLLALALLWLIVRHRAAGLIALGSGGIIGVIGMLSVVAVITSTLVRSAKLSPFSAFIGAANRDMTSVTWQHALWIASGSLLLLLLGIAIILLLRKRQRNHQTLHFGSEQ